MLRNLAAQTPWWLNLLQKLIHPAWAHSALLRLPITQLEKGSLTITLNGESHRFQGKQAGAHAELIIDHPVRAYWLMKTQGQLGFAQAYYEGAVKTNSLFQLLTLGHQNREALRPFLTLKKGNRWQLNLHRKRHNSLQNSKNNISYHYDLGNDFYSLWLDKTMSYSSALEIDAAKDFAAAQTQKYQRIWSELDVNSEADILEIGCGWGGFMETAALNGASVKGLTLSKEQAAFAEQRLQAIPGGEKSRVALQDYRLEDEQYDGIVSIEMFEAVGKEYWDEYFQVLYRSLKPGAKAVLQIITIADEQAEAYQDGVDFIQTYIFPGGLLPSIAQLKKLADKHGLAWKNDKAFGKDYATTCLEWKKRFNHHSAKLQKMGYDDAFQRLWNYYLDYCAVGFTSGHINVYQMTLEKTKAGYTL